MILMKGEEAADRILKRVSREIEEKKLSLKLVAILVGNDPASRIYVNSKKKDCEKVGIHSEILSFPEDVSEEDLLEAIKKLNDDSSVNGILCQLPLPSHINERNVLEAINPFKDVDCFHPYNIGRLFAGFPLVEPCTPKGVIELLNYYGIELTGKRAVVVGRSNIVGKPLSIMLLSRNCTVTICHSKTVGLENITKEGDLVFAALGKPYFIRGDMVKNGVVVVDIGINRLEDVTSPKGYKVVGDVDFNEVSNKAYAITPVPGGVGLMTRAVLMENILRLGIIQKDLHR